MRLGSFLILAYVPEENGLGTPVGKIVKSLKYLPSCFITLRCWNLGYVIPVVTELLTCITSQNCYQFLSHCTD